VENPGIPLFLTEKNLFSRKKILVNYLYEARTLFSINGDINGSKKEKEEIIRV